MKLISLKIEYLNFIKVIDFGKKTLIYSSNNSSGKSTLLRLIFFSMGYSIPQTKGIDFSKIKTTLSLENSNKIEKLDRCDNNITIHYQDKSSTTFLLPHDDQIVFSEIWCTNNINVIDNILGTVYMDQEKGWTLLNRGTVIGNIKFKIEDFIEGLSERNLTNQKIELENVTSELKKYSQILNIIEYKNHLLEENSSSLFITTYSEHLDRELHLLSIKKIDLENKLNELKESLLENDKFIEYVEKMNLVVREETSDKLISVNRQNIVNFSENQQFIKTRILIQNNELSKINKQIRQKEVEIQKADNLFTLQNEIEKINHLVSKVNIPYENIEKTISSLKKQKKILNDEIKNKVSYNNPILNNLHMNIMKYAEILKVEQYIDLKKNYIFTSDLKSLSGAILHKIVFSFKMAYIIELQNYLGYKVPIVLDSPSGRELNKENIEDTLDLLNKDFKDNQIIIASIFQFTNFKPDEHHELLNKLFE